MASRKERHRILASSMSLVPPGDKIGPGQSIQLDNWRVDQSGELRTRGAAAVETGVTLPVGSGTYHTLRRTSNFRYSGIGTDLYFGPEPAGSVLITGGFDGNPLGMAFYQGFAWVMNRSKQKRIEYQTPARWGVIAPTTAPVAADAGAGGVELDGSYRYYVSFFNAALQDGMPSPASNIIEVAESQISLSSIPVSADPEITGRYIYRIGGSVNQAFRVGTLFDNTTTTWLDNCSDEAAQNNGIEMPINRDLPPPARGVIGPFFGKLIAFSTADHPARYFWTPAGIPWAFYGADDPDIGDWEDAGGDDDELLQITDHKTTLILYKQRSIWRLVGDPVTSDPVRTNANMGLVGPNAVVNAGALDYFVGAEGVYSFNGDFETKISDAIDPIFKGDFTRLSSGEAIPPVDKASIVNCTIALVGDRLRVCYPEAGQIQPNVVLVYNTGTGEWVREKYNGLAAPAFTVMTYEGPGRYLLGGATAGSGAYLYALELLQNLVGDNGNSFRVVWQSRFEDQGLPDNFKIYSDLEIDFQTAYDSPVSTLSVYLVFDKWTKVLLGTISSATQTTVTLRIPPDTIRAGQGALFGYRAKNVAVRIEGDVLPIAKIYGTYLHWYPEERTADTFDSGPTALSLPERVKEVDYLEFYVTASGQSLQRVLWSDLPGSILTARDTNSFSAPSGRGNIRQRLTAVDGRNFRLVVANSGTGQLFQMHQARMRSRPIGEYIDGTIGEYYESPEFSVAPGRVGELKDFLLDYDVSAPGGRLELYSDLPGHAMALRRQIAIPYQAGRGVYVFPLESVADTTSESLPAGQLFKVRLYPPAGGILRLHGRAAFRARVLGVYFEGANGEVWETQNLDLLGGMGIFRNLLINAQTSGPMTLQMFTELPNQDMRQIATFTINPSATTAQRLSMVVRLPGNCKGHLQRFKLSGNAICRLYEVKVLARRLEVNGTAWDWVSVPVEPTPDAWATIQMPVRETPEAFTWIDLPVDTVE